MRYPRIFGMAMFVMLPCLISAAQISEMDNALSMLTTSSVAWSGLLDVQVSALSDVTSPVSNSDVRDAAVSSVNLFLSKGSSDQASDIAGVLISEGPESRSGLIYTISIFVALSVLLKYLSSPGFYDLFSDMFVTISAITYEGRDWKPDA